MVISTTFSIVPSIHTHQQSHRDRQAQLAGIPFEMSQRAHNIYHLSTTRPPSSATDMMQGIMKQMIDMEEGFRSYDALTNEIVLVIPVVYAILGDNAIAQELGSLMIGPNAKHPCRVCSAEANHTSLANSSEFMEIGQLRKAEKTLKELREQVEMVVRCNPKAKFDKKQKSTGVKCKWTQWFLDVMTRDLNMTTEEQRREWLRDLSESGDGDAHISIIWRIKGMFFICLVSTSQQVH